MYSYEWDASTGGYILNSTPLAFSKEPRPVYYKELDILGFDAKWNYPKSDAYPLMWAEANNYYYRGRLVAKTKGGSICKAPELIFIEAPEPNGEELKFVDVPAMVEKNRNILESLTQEAIKKIYNVYSSNRKKYDIFYVAFSGGKDSIVTLDLVQRAIPHNEFIVLFGDTKMEFPDTYDIVNEIKKLCNEKGIGFHIATSDLEPEYTWKEFGPPAQKIRWCCSVHKSAPQINYLRKYIGKLNFKGMSFTGIRADESFARSEYDETSYGDKIKGQDSFRPILAWNSAELYLYIYANNLLINEAYKKGNSRAGCLVCPMAADRNMYIKECCYAQSNFKKTTTTFNNLILETTSKDLSTKAAIKEFMNIGGWKARRSGRELNNVTAHLQETREKDKLVVDLLVEKSDWCEWIKTVGAIDRITAENFNIRFENHDYNVRVSSVSGITRFEIFVNGNTKTDIYFMSAIKTALKKSAYCIGCRVCEANCPNGCITFVNQKIKINDSCVHCRKCHDIASGCLVYNSIKLPKGETSMMGSVDRYTNMGIEFMWVKGFFEKGDVFWESDNGLGSKMVISLKRFLADAQLTTKNVLNSFGQMLLSLGIDSETTWGLMVCNLAYTAQFNWWIKNIEFNNVYSSDSIFELLGSEMTENTRNHIVSAFKNIFISNIILGEGLGLGICDYELKGGKRYLTSIRRSSWKNPEPKVILYALYKFSEACGNYKQFSLTRLLNHEIESDGISPTQIFGLDRTTMERILNGLSNNYPDFISVSFTLDLDNINLKDKTSDDVLSLFEGV